MDDSAKVKPSGRQRRVGVYSLNPDKKQEISSAQPKERRHTHHAAPTGIVESSEGDLRKRVLKHQLSCNETTSKAKLEDDCKDFRLPGRRHKSDNDSVRARAYSTPDTIARDEALKKYYLEKIVAMRRAKMKEVYHLCQL